MERSVGEWNGMEWNGMEYKQETHSLRWLLVVQDSKKTIHSVTRETGGI